MRLRAAALVLAATGALTACGEESSCAAAEDPRREWLGAADAQDDLPAPDAPMDVPVWDPSGEALVNVTDGDQVRGLWLVHEDDGWPVAGEAP